MILLNATKIISFVFLKFIFILLFLEQSFLKYFCDETISM